MFATRRRGCKTDASTSSSRPEASTFSGACDSCSRLFEDEIQLRGGGVKNVNVDDDVVELQLQWRNRTPDPAKLVH